MGVVGVSEWTNLYADGSLLVARKQLDEIHDMCVVGSKTKTSRRKYNGRVSGARNTISSELMGVSWEFQKNPFKNLMAGCWRLQKM